MFKEEKEKIMFNNFKEFYERAEEILYNFEVVSFCPFFSLRKYKEYVYSKRMTTAEKDICWEVLMGDIMIEELRGENYD